MVNKEDEDGKNTNPRTKRAKTHPIGCRAFDIY